MLYLAALLLAELAFAAPTSSQHKASPFTSKVSRFTRPLEKRQDWQSWSNPSQPTKGYSGRLASDIVHYLATVEVEGQEFQLVLDSGSSDTWIAQTDFHCWNSGNHTTHVFSGAPQVPCNYGSLYTPGTGFDPVTNFTQYTCYGQGNEGTERCVGGEFGEVTIGINGLDIPNTIVGAPLNSSAYELSNVPVFSGILGMAFPNITSGLNSAGKEVKYPSVLQNAFYNQDLSIEKKWSLALSRDESGTGDAGTFTIGGLPDLTDPSINATSEYVSTPLVLRPNHTAFDFYIIEVDGFSFGEETADGLAVVIDSGSPGVELPADLANSINNQWTPAANITDDGGVIVECTATLPAPVGITIGATTIFIEAQDLLIDGTVAGLDAGLCLSQVAPGVGKEFILGDGLLLNTLAVFDWGESQLTFYPRQYYKS